MPDARSPLGVGLEWAYRILAVALEMVLPGVAGGWLDKRWGTSFISPLGFVLGLVLGFCHLLLMTRGGGQRVRDDKAADRENRRS